MSGERRSRIKIRVENKDYDVIGDDFQQILAAVKALPNRRFNGQLKLWEVSGSLAMVRGQLENSGFIVEGGTPAPAGSAVEETTSSDRIKVEVAGYPLVVSGGSFQAMLAIIKELPGRRFDSERKQWSIPGTPAEIKAHLEKKGLTVEAQPGEPEPPPSAPPDEAFPPPPDFDEPAGQPSPPPPPPPPDLLPPDDDFYAEAEEVDDYPYFDETFPPPDDFPPAPSVPTSTHSPAGQRDRIRVIVGNKPLLVVGGTFQAMLAAVKEIPNRRFDSETKQWLLPGDFDSVQGHLRAKGFWLEEG